MNKNTKNGAIFFIQNYKNETNFKKLRKRINHVKVQLF